MFAKRTRKGIGASRFPGDGLEDPGDDVEVLGMLERRDLEADQPPVLHEPFEHAPDVGRLEPARDRELDGHDRRVEPVAVEVHVHGPFLRHAGPQAGGLDLDLLVGLEVTAFEHPEHLDVVLEILEPVTR